MNDLPQIDTTYHENILETHFTLSIIESFIIAFTTELADKTFVLILILKLKSNKSTVFFSSLIGMSSLTALSVMMGYFLDYFLYQHFIDLVVILIFFFSGIGIIMQGISCKSKTYEDELLTNIKDELREQKKREKLIDNKIIFQERRRLNSLEIEDLNDDDSCCQDQNSLKEPLLKANTCFQFKKIDNELAFNSLRSSDNLHRKENENDLQNNQVEIANQGGCYYFWAFLKAIFIAEFGDRTQLTLFALSSVLNSFGVILGAIAGIIFVISLGVFYGNQISKKLSERTMCFICGFLFLIVFCQVILASYYFKFLWN